MDQPPPITEIPQRAEPASPGLSLTARLLNVFADPGEVFESVRASKRTLANWLVPALLLSAVGVLSSFVMFSQPAIVQSVREQQAHAMDDLVKSGKLTEADAERALAATERFMTPTLLAAFGAAGATVASLVRMFWWAFVMWLLALIFLKARPDFLKLLEVAGLTSMIAVLGAVVTMLLIVSFGKVSATPSLALAISDFDLRNKTHLLLGSINVFHIWSVGVFACGLAKLSGAPFAKAFLLLLGYFVLQQLFLVFTGMGQAAL